MALQLESAVSRRVFWTVLVPSWLAVGAGWFVFAAAHAWPEWARWLPFALSVVLLGLPHGAVDHIVALRLWGRRSVSALLIIFAAYVSIAAAYAAVWFVAPGVAFVGFIVLTWWHWGQGDVHALLGLHGAEHLISRSDRYLASFVRGGLPMMVPLIAYPDVYRDVAIILTSRMAQVDLSALAWAFGLPFRSVVAVVLGLVTLLLLVRGARRDSRGARVDALEILMLVTLFVTVEPIFAVGLYFCVWHSPRHIVRLITLDPTTSRWIKNGSGWRAWARFGLAAAPLTVAALAMIAALQWIVPVPATDVAAWMGIYLIGIACLTLPHTLVVAWLDRSQGLWTGKEGRAG